LASGEHSEAIGTTSEVQVAEVVLQLLVGSGAGELRSLPPEVPDTGSIAATAKVDVTDA